MARDAAFSLPAPRNLKAVFKLRFCFYPMQTRFTSFISVKP